MSAAATGGVLGLFWLLAAKVCGQQQQSTPLSCCFQCHPTLCFQVILPSCPCINQALGAPSPGTPQELSGPFQAFLGACPRIWAAVPRGLFPWLMSRCDSRDWPRLGKGTEGLRFPPWCLEGVQRLAPRVAGQALMTFTWLLCLVLLSSAAHGFPPARIHPPAHPSGEERAGLGTLPSLSTLADTFCAQLRAQRGLLGQGVTGNGLFQVEMLRLYKRLPLAPRRQKRNEGIALPHPICYGGATSWPWAQFHLVPRVVWLLLGHGLDLCTVT